MKLLLAALSLAVAASACAGVSTVRTEAKQGDLLVATSTENMFYVVDKRTKLCFFVYAGEPSGTVVGPSGVAPVPCERLRGIPELANQIDFLEPGERAATPAVAK